MATNVTINGKEYYRIKRVVGHETVDGKKKPVHKYFYGRSKTDAEKQHRAYVEEQMRMRLDRDPVRDSSSIHKRAEEFIESYLDPSEKYAKGTKTRYKAAYKKHMEGTWLDRMQARDVKASDIQRFYNELDVSKDTLRSVHKFMSAFYKWMQLNRYAHDELSAVTLPAKGSNPRKDDIVIWSSAEWDRLTGAKFDFRHDFLIKLMSYTGMRISECLALKYSDIDDTEIHVRRQFYLGEIKAPKYNSIRDIPVHPKVRSALEIHRAWHKDEMRKKKYKTDFVFTTPQGTLYNITNIQKTFDRFYRDNGFTRHTFHVYRATFCTKLCEAGVPLEVASKLLGHKSLQVTAQHYALVSRDTKQDAVLSLS